MGDNEAFEVLRLQRDMAACGAKVEPKDWGYLVCTDCGQPENMRQEMM